MFDFTGTERGQAIRGLDRNGRATVVTRDAWFPFRTALDEPSVRLVCVPPAGKGCSVFRGWQASAPAGVEVLGVQFPGRETRLGEQPVDRVEVLADGIAAALERYSDRPLALFGHCFGAVVAFEVARRLPAGRAELLCVSSCKPPHLLGGTSWFGRGRPDVEILREAYGDAVADLPEELLDELRPGLMSDLVALDHYQSDGLEPLDLSLHALVWEQDRTVTPAELREWRRYGDGFGEIAIGGDREMLAPQGAVITAAIDSLRAAGARETRAGAVA